MIDFAERMTARYCEGDTLRVLAYQRRNLTRVEQGLQVGDEWTDYVEPVCTRRYISTRWIEVQPVAKASSKIGTFFRDRPDQAD